MNRCFQLAKRGSGSVSPNPKVGSVIVYKDRIIGEGWHRSYGEPHAEVNAIDSVAEKDRHLLSKSTMYVNLEPCNHFGKTPPCSDLIVKHKLKRVVISTVDSNPKVDGSGIDRLTQNGIEVTTGILEEKGRALNQRFFTSIEKKRPYIILKWAESKDGFIAKHDQQQTWITNEISRRFVHKMRSEEDAILIGKNTLIIDNPKLNNRFFDHKKQPKRIIISEQIPDQKDLNIFDQHQTTILVNSVKEGIGNGMQYWQFDFHNNFIFNLLKRLNKHSVQSIIIEGGAYTLQQFITQNLWDEALVLVGDIEFTSGIKSPQINTSNYTQIKFNSDTVTYYINS